MRGAADFAERNECAARAGLPTMLDKIGSRAASRRKRP